MGGISLTDFGQTEGYTDTHTSMYIARLRRVTMT